MQRSTTATRRSQPSKDASPPSNVLPDKNRETPHSEYLFNNDYEVTGGELHYRDGEFYLHVRTEADVEFETADEGNGGHSTVPALTSASKTSLSHQQALSGTGQR